MNYTEQAKQQLIKTLHECKGAVRDADVFLSLESHQLVTLKNAEVTKEVLDTVDSLWVRCDYDPTNRG